MVGATTPGNAALVGVIDDGLRPAVTPDVGRAQTVYPDFFCGMANSYRGRCGYGVWPFEAGNMG